MKKIISLILALMLLASLSVTAFAAEETGSITINGVSDTTTYEIYKLLDLESYDVAQGAYSYKANAAWATFFATDEAKAYMATDADGYVTWATTEDDDTKAAFAKMALAYAKANGIAPVKSSRNAGCRSLSQFSCKRIQGIYRTVLPDTIFQFRIVNHVGNQRPVHHGKHTKPQPAKRHKCHIYPHIFRSDDKKRKANGSSKNICHYTDLRLTKFSCYRLCQGRSNEHGNYHSNCGCRLRRRISIKIRIYIVCHGLHGQLG